MAKDIKFKSYMHNDVLIRPIMTYSYFGTALIDNSLLLGGQAPKWARGPLLLKVRGLMGPYFPISRIITVYTHVSLLWLLPRASVHQTDVFM